MLARVAAFEFRYQLRNPVLWIAFGLFFLLSFGPLAAGAASVSSDGPGVHANGPFAIARTQAALSIFYMFVTAAFVATVVVRDDDTAFGPIVRSTRITKFDYLFGRFLGAILVASLGFLAIPIGIWLGSLTPWIDPALIGPNRAAYYLQPYLLLALPNVLVTGAIFFALAAATRSMMATYLGVVALLILWVIVNVALDQAPEYQEWLSIADPFGLTATEWTTRYWTAAERDGRLLDPGGLILWNRLLWLAIAAAFLAIAAAAYRFAELGMSKRQLRRARRLAADESAVGPSAAASPRRTPRHDAAGARAQFAARTRFETRQVFRSPAFLVLMTLGLFNTIGNLWFAGDIYGTPIHPATFRMIPELRTSFAIIPLIVAIYYAGELVWRERERNMHEIIDATPLPNWAMALPKIVAIALVLLATLAIAAIGAILVQFLKGHADVQIGRYLLWYILPSGLDMVLIAILAVFVQTLSPNKYVGWAVMVLYIVALIAFPTIGLEHGLYLYGAHPAEPLSDMNGAGTHWIAAWWFRLFWSVIAILLPIGAHLLWPRGVEARLRSRLGRARTRLSGAVDAIAGLAVLVAALIGSWIYYNTSALNRGRTPAQAERYFAGYERRFLRYETLPQPSITHIQLAIELHPDQVRAEISGRYRLTNLSGRPVDQVHVRRLDRSLELRAVDLPAARLVLDDPDYGYRIYRLDRPMAPGETRTLTFRTHRQQVGFRAVSADTRLVGNGTFLNSFELAPIIGMNRAGLLQARAARRGHGLPGSLHQPRLDDPAGAQRHAFGDGWTTADITISTAADQVPIAPGRKVSDAVGNGRRTVRFISDAPIIPFFAIHSARYAEARRVHDGTTLSVFHHPGHPWNVDRMLDAMQRSLEHYRANFGPYPFGRAQIVEFPAYQTFAPAFANTIPISEATGFLANPAAPNGIDYVSYVTAHELAHQYWAHQVTGADMQGRTMLSETLAQYSALMVMKHLHGEDRIRRLLQFELDTYLRGRAGGGELPLARVENQAFIHHQKGSLAMYLLQQRMGEAAVNRALRRFLERYRFRGAPYPRSTDLIRLLREEARTAEQQALITDLFERITLYDLNVERSTARRRADGRWDVAVTVDARKFYADDRGAEREVPLGESIEVGLFTAAPGRGAFDRSNVVAMERRPIRSGRQVLRFVTRQRPTHAGVDPYNFYIDRNSDDNIAPVS